MFALMLQTSLLHVARAFLAVLTSWHFQPMCARVCSSLICAGGKGGGGHLESFDKSPTGKHHADIVDVGAHMC